MSVRSRALPQKSGEDADAFAYLHARSAVVDHCIPGFTIVVACDVGKAHVPSHIEKAAALIRVDTHILLRVIERK